MKQIAVLVEGQTEEAFVREALTPHLWTFGIHAQAVIVETSRSAAGAKHKGGGGTWKHYRRDIMKLLGSTHFVLVTTILDFYAYPTDAPGEDCERPHVPRACVRTRADAMAADIDDPRFLPYLILHEFETLVLATSIGRTTVLGSASLADCFRTHCADAADDVELLNDGPTTAPSKRVLQCNPEYDKVADGVAAINEAGLHHVATHCAGFAGWVHRLQAVGVGAE